MSQQVGDKTSSDIPVDPHEEAETKRRVERKVAVEVEVVEKGGNGLFQQKKREIFPYRNHTKEAYPHFKMIYIITILKYLFSSTSAAPSLTAGLVCSLR